MNRSHESQSDEKFPTRLGSFIFRFKSSLLQLQRFFQGIFGSRARAFQKKGILLNDTVICESKTPLWTELEPEERSLVAGKIQNLRLAVARIDGVQIPPGEVFSFWKHIGRATRIRGFVAGREIREGCIIPTIGGGLCQLSNALYDAALRANFEIVERHAHTQVVAGSLAEHGRDATVFWNYIDLRFRSTNAFQIEAKMGSDHLTVRFRGMKNEGRSLHQISRSAINNSHINSCATCGMEDCFRAAKPNVSTIFGRSAYLLDEFSPEFDEYIQKQRNDGDLICLPIDGRRFRKPNYAWNTSGFAKVAQSFVLTAERSLRSRRLAAQGAARQQNLLAMNEKLAANYANKLDFDVLHVVVQQNLLPFLWRDGHLGGRTFDVLMSALPMTNLQQQLDHAYSSHQESKTLADFRADIKLVEAESEALKKARKIITPHTYIASIFGDQAELLDWAVPNKKAMDRKRTEKPCIVFPASTVGRKGCYELRDTLKGLEVKLLLLGPIIENPDFWKGFDVEAGGPDWLQYADLVVLPAYVEHRPRRLVLAASSGIPVIASHACGVENVEGIETIETNSREKLSQMIISNLDSMYDNFYRLNATN